jgi:hypothetical protein
MNTYKYCSYTMEFMWFWYEPMKTKICIILGFIMKNYVHHNHTALQLEPQNN